MAKKKIFLLILTLGVLGLAAVALEAMADQPLHLLSNHYRQKNLVSDGALPAKHTEDFLCVRSS
jgi:hypothetical protein